MKTLLLATGGAAQLAPLTDLTTDALLPVADKPLLIHAVESLALAGLAEVIVVVAAFGDEVRKTLGDGAQWGMRFEYLAERDVQRRLVADLSHDYLVIRGEILRTPIINEFLARAATLEAPVIAATIRGVAAGVTIIRRRTPMPWLASAPLARMSQGSTVIDFPEAGLSLIDSPAALHQANLDVIAGRFPGLMLGGCQLMPQVRAGRKSHLPLKAVKGVPVFVGARCRIAASAELMSETVISSDSVIDSRATLHRAVVMPHTYVGALVQVSDAIVSGNLVIHIDSGTHAWVTDQFLLCSISKRPLVTLVEGAVARFGRMLRAVYPLSWTRPSRLPDGERDGASPAEVRLAWNHRVDPQQEAAVERERVVDRVARA